MICTSIDWNHRPSRCSSFIASKSALNVANMPGIISVLPLTKPPALFITFCATSNTAITIFHVLERIITAAKVFISHFAKIQVSMSCMLFFSIMRLISSYVATKVRMIPAMGSTTVVERFCIRENTPGLNAPGVCPTVAAMLPT